MSLPPDISGATCFPCQLDLGIHVPSLIDDKYEESKLEDCQLPQNIEISDINDCEVGGDDAAPLELLPVQLDGTEEERKYCKRLRSLENWYPRASWAEKLDFLTSLLDTMDRTSIYRLVTHIGPPTKDMIYAYSQFTNTLYDMVPIDDNRTLDERKIKELKSRDLEWFRTLQDQNKFKIMSDLLEVGGGALQRRIYSISHARLLKSEAERLARIEEELAKARMTRGSSTSLKKKSGSKKKKKSSQKSSPKQPEGPAHVKLKNALRDWDRLMNGLAKLAGLKKKKSKKKMKKNEKETAEDSGPNQIELLPLWVNRAILKSLDHKSLMTASKVSQYWEDSIKAVKTETSTRKALDKTLIKMEAKCALPMSVRKKKGGKKGKKKEKKRKHKSVPGSKNKKHDSKERSKSAEPSVHVPEGEVKRTEVRLVVTPAMLLDCPPNVYNTRHTVVKIPDSFAANPSLAANRRWLALASGTDVHLKTLITGGELVFSLTGHKESITAMVFHPSNDYLVTGSHDNTVRVWEVWSQHLHKLLIAHTEAIIDVTASERYVASVGLDKLINIFKWDRWECRWTVTEVDDLSCIRLSNDNVLYAGTATGRIKIYDVPEGEKLLDIEYCHLGAVTCVFLADPLIATSGADGFVRLWDYWKLDNKCMIALKHRGRVNDVAISHFRVVAGCEGGDIHIWDVVTGSLLRRIVASLEFMPVLALRVVEYDDHSKVIACCESGVTVYNFPYNRKRGRTRVKPTKIIDDNMNINKTFDKRLRAIKGTMKTNERREQQLNTRLCTVPQLRALSGVEVHESVVRDVLVEEGTAAGTQVRCFSHPEPYKDTEDEVRAGWSVVEEDAKFRRHLPNILSYKDTLPIYNPYKFSL